MRTKVCRSVITGSLRKGNPLQKWRDLFRSRFLFSILFLSLFPSSFKMQRFSAAFFPTTLKNTALQRSIFHLLQVALSLIALLPTPSPSLECQHGEEHRSVPMHYR